MEREENESVKEDLLDDFKGEVPVQGNILSLQEFDQLIQDPYLRRMGVQFTNKGVQVSNDGGDDGYIYHIDGGDFRTTRVVIQCKRFNDGTVSEPDI